jgi:RHS repeat-associated protein
MEKDDEVNGSGNSYDFGERLYNPQLGRWWGTDPMELKYPYLSPYVGLGNKPIVFVDRDGADTWFYTSQGVFLGKTEESLANSVVIIDEITFNTVSSLHGFSSENLTSSDVESVKSFGMVYNLEQIEDFWANNIGKKAIKDPNGNDVSSGESFNSEVSSLIFSSGNNANIGNDYIYTDYEAAHTNFKCEWSEMSEYERKSFVGFIHIHPMVSDDETPYSFVNNNPICFVDPHGLAKVRRGGDRKVLNKRRGPVNQGKGKKGPKPNPVRKGENYYIDRKKDFEGRNPGKPAPTYYKEYGDKYLHRFKYETKQTLSPQGQRWLDKALINLQDEMEKGLMRKEDPADEYDNEKFTDFAFDTHVKAYEDAGILDLSVVDKVKIMLTVDPDDLFSARGFKQGKDVAIDQLIKYNNEPIFAMEQAAEIVLRQNTIKYLIMRYALKHGLEYSKVHSVVMSPFTSIK